MAKKTTNRKKTTSRRKTSATRGGTRKSTPRKSTRKRSTTKRTTSKRTTRKRPTKQQSRVSMQKKVLFGGGIVVFMAAILALSLLGPSQGQLTAGLTDITFTLFGWGGWIIPFIGFAIGLYMVFWGMDQPVELPTFRLVGAGLLFTIFESATSLGVMLSENGLNDVWTIAKAHQGGGYFGGLFTYALMNLVGTLGTVFTLVVVAIIGLILVSGLTRDDMSYYLHEFVEGIKNRPEREPAAPREVVINTPRTRRSVTSPTDPVGTQPPLLPETDAEADPKQEPKRDPEPKKRPSRRKKKQTPESPKAEPTIVSPVYLGGNGRSKDHHWQLPTIPEMLEPGMDQDNSGTIIREQVEIIEHTLDSFGAPAKVVEINQGPTITQFGVEPSYIQMRNGKRTKVKVGKIAGLADDLTLALTAASIRIQAPVPGKGYVGIEVPNPAKALVSLRDVMETSEFSKAARKSPLAIGLGQDVAGQPIVANLDGMPHLLIAGTTGSGKSVCVNGIIACLLLQNTPDTLKLVMVDPKRVELTGYNGIPHLAAPVIVEIDKVIGTLQWALREMDNRYKQFAEVGARNIVDYNKKVRRHKKFDPIPYIVIIIDELADLMMLSPEDTERSVTRLAQLARATGMHMVIATQRPSVDVVTGLIKANFPARVAFAVASGTDSRVILDATGAERLLGQGDMLYQSPDAAAPVRSQGCYVSDEELAKLIAYWQRARRFNMVPAEESLQKREPRKPAPKPKARAVPPKPATPPAEPVDAPVINMEASPTSEAKTVVNAKPVRKKATPEPQPKQESPTIEPEQQPLWEALQAAENADDGPPELNDDLLPEAIAMVRKLNKASTSLLQRRFRIGYTRAARIVDYMEEAGIIGPPTGTSKAREVLPWDGEVVEEGEQ
ncbi:MAG: DNA translocase FtsK [Chloroflexi bacterium]|nr:MAG: DNA translocase FtsK [Chloroflexota bacterium]